jgi:hypothetical protein
MKLNLRSAKSPSNWLIFPGGTIKLLTDMESFMLGDTIRFTLHGAVSTYCRAINAFNMSSLPIVAPVVGETVKFGCRFVYALSSQFNRVVSNMHCMAL